MMYYTSNFFRILLISAIFLASAALSADLRRPSIVLRLAGGGDLRASNNAAKQQPTGFVHQPISGESRLINDDVNGTIPLRKAHKVYQYYF